MCYRDGANPSENEETDIFVLFLFFVLFVFKYCTYCLVYEGTLEQVMVVREKDGHLEWFNSGKLIGWQCLSPATSLVLQSAAILVSRPDQVNYLGDTTGEYGLHRVIEQNTTLASIHLCNRVDCNFFFVCSCLSLFSYIFFSFRFIFLFVYLLWSFLLHTFFFFFLYIFFLLYGFAHSRPLSPARVTCFLSSVVYLLFFFLFLAEQQRR